MLRILEHVRMIEKNGHGKSKQAWNDFYDSAGGLTDIYCVSPIHGINAKTVKGNVCYAFADNSDNASFTILTMDQSDPKVFELYKKRRVPFFWCRLSNGGMICKICG